MLGRSDDHRKTSVDKDNLQLHSQYHQLTTETLLCLAQDLRLEKTRNDGSSWSYEREMHGRISVLV